MTHYEAQKKGHFGHVGKYEKQQIDLLFSYDVQKQKQFYVTFTNFCL